MNSFKMSGPISTLMAHHCFEERKGVPLTLHGVLAALHLYNS